MKRGASRRKHTKIRDIIVDYLEEQYPRSSTTDQIQTMLLAKKVRFSGSNTRLSQIIVRTPGIRKDRDIHKVVNVLGASYTVDAYYLNDMDKYEEWRAAKIPEQRSGGGRHSL